MVSHAIESLDRLENSLAAVDLTLLSYTAGKLLDSGTSNFFYISFHIQHAVNKITSRNGEKREKNYTFTRFQALYKKETKTIILPGGSWKTVNVLVRLSRRMDWHPVQLPGGLGFLSRVCVKYLLRVNDCRSQKFNHAEAMTCRYERIAYNSLKVSTSFRPP